MLQIGRSLARSQLVSLEFFIDIKSFRSHYGPGVDSASNRNEYREYSLRGKNGRCVRPTTLPPSCAIVIKSGNLNFLEPSGPLQVCNGTALLIPVRHRIVTGKIKLMTHGESNHGPFCLKRSVSTDGATVCCWSCNTRSFYR